MDAGEGWGELAGRARARPRGSCGQRADPVGPVTRCQGQQRALGVMRGRVERGGDGGGSRVVCLLTASLSGDRTLDPQPPRPRPRCAFQCPLPSPHCPRAGARLTCHCSSTPDLSAVRAWGAALSTSASPTLVLSSLRATLPQGLCPDLRLPSSAQHRLLREAFLHLWLTFLATAHACPPPWTPPG